MDRLHTTWIASIWTHPLIRANGSPASGTRCRLRMPAMSVTHRSSPSSSNFIFDMQRLRYRNFESATGDFAHQSKTCRAWKGSVCNTTLHQPSFPKREMGQLALQDLMIWPFAKEVMLNMYAPASAFSLKFVYLISTRKNIWMSRSNSGNRNG